MFIWDFRCNLTLRKQAYVIVYEVLTQKMML